MPWRLKENHHYEHSFAEIEVAICDHLSDRFSLLYVACELVGEGGSRLDFWDLEKGALVEELDLGAEYRQLVSKLPCESGFLHFRFFNPFN